MNLERTARAQWFASLMAMTGWMSDAAAQDIHAESRRKMVEEIAVMARDTAGHTGRAGFSARVMEAMRKVERHRLVPQAEQRNAYQNRPLPIGNGQTISQPYIVALMTDLLDVGPSDKVLEIGTGSGYQAAVLAEIVRAVYTIEIVEPLGRAAAQKLQELGYRNVTARIGDGYQGWPDQAPFDAIIVTAAAREVPQPLIDQLKSGGRLVIPVGAQSGAQELLVITKSADGKTVTRSVLAVRFVPLTGSGSAVHNK